MRIFLNSVFLFWSMSLFAQDYSRFVKPMVGTDYNGHTFPGATTPFGMVQLSPDTRIDGSWAGCSGYHYSDSIIYGFSHTHMSGTGVSDYGDFLIMPQIGEPSFDPGDYAASFKHQNEVAEAGFYSVRMDNGIRAELTATTRVGFHQYRFPEGEFSVIIDLTHRDELLDYHINLINKKTIALKRVSTAWARNQHAYAYMDFSSAFKATFNADSTKVILRFKNKHRSLQIRVALSFTGVNGAKRNLETELNHWYFEKVKEDARSAWNRELKRIEVRDPDEEKLRVFYTAFYHALIHPNTAMDVDGSYRGMDNQIHQATDFTYYTVFSLWDTFRATHPLHTIIDRKRTRDFIKTFLAMYEQGGRLPVWELCSNETDCMIGYHSASVIADALSKGITDFDVALAYEAMKKSATWNHLGLPEYQTFGYLSVEAEHESVSKTLEYAYDDWCIARVADYLGDTAGYQTYIHRANAWRNLLDPETMFMRPRVNGGWLTPFEPREVNNHFTEGNAWQYSFFVPHQVPDLIAEFGQQAFERRLDSLFNAPTQTTGRTQPDISGLIGQYAHGNEPSHHIAYLYNYLGKKDKSTKLVHRILTDFYSSKPDGLIGNEDCGQMSAWYVLSSLGLYPVSPGQAEYALVEPYFNSFTVHLENGRFFSKNDFVERFADKLFVSHQELTDERCPQRNFKTLMNVPYLPPPVIYSQGMSFIGKTTVTINSPVGSSIRYLLQHENIHQLADTHQLTLTIDRTTVLEAQTVLKQGNSSTTSPPTLAEFVKQPHPTWKVDLRSTYNTQYSAGGPRGIIDGIHGDKNWRKGGWQGYQDQDFELILELDSIQDIRRLRTTFLQDTRSWIIFPTAVEYLYSTDGVNYQTIVKLQPSIGPEDYEVQIAEFKHLHTTTISARFIKVVAKNFGELPAWHQGAGGGAFIFVDEVEVE